MPLPSATTSPTATIRVCIVVACYNGGRYLAETLRSVGRQTFPGWECVVVDHGSTDDSAAIAHRFAAAHLVRHSRRPVEPDARLVEIVVRFGHGTRSRRRITTALTRLVPLTPAPAVSIVWARGGQAWTVTGRRRSPSRAASRWSPS